MVAVQWCVVGTSHEKSRAHDDAWLLDERLGSGDGEHSTSAMKASELLKIHAVAKKQVQVSCDEYHAHTTKCLSGPKDAVTICKLVEEVARLRSIISDAAASLDA